MEDVLEVYHRPYDARRPVVCVDETSKQLAMHTRVPLPARPGQLARHDDEYRRNGVANIFLATEPLTGRRLIEVTQRRRRGEYAAFVRRLLNEVYPDADKVVLVCDQLNIHEPASLYEAFAPAEARRLLDRLELHVTPKHGSWLNVAEIDLSRLSRQCLAQRIGDHTTLRREITQWQKNSPAAPMQWRFTTADARIKLRRLYPSASP
jgi:hypothetical protein